MAPFSVISRDDQVDDLVEVEDESATPERIDRAIDSLSRDVAALGSLDDRSIPRVLLELPDLASMSQWSEQRWSNWGNRIFWVGIVLGSVVALYLIWQPRRVPAPQHEAAPTWHGQSAPAAVSAPATALPSLSSATRDHAHEHGELHEPHDQSAASSWPAESEASPTQPANPTQPTGAGEFPGGAPAAEPSTAPSSDEWSHQRQDAGAIYTARSVEARLDGGAPRAPAGEAIPTGKIKSVVTP